MEENIYIDGTIESVIYTNEDNGYSVIRIISSDGEEITATGTMPNVSRGEDIVLAGNWQSHSTYGDQFVVTSFEISLPSTEKGIIEYLSSRVIKGIGPRVAKKIVERFGVETFDIICTNPEMLTEIRGISAKKAQEISEKFLKQSQIRTIMEFLIENELDSSLASRIYKTMGDDALYIINENPYILCEEDFGVDFLVMDKIALQLSVDVDSKIRTKAGILYVLKFNLQNGHSFIPQDKLIVATCNLLSQDKEQIEECIYELVNSLQIMIEKILNISAVYLSDLHSAECFVTDYLMNLREYKYEYDFEILDLINEIEGDRGIEYASKQKDAIEMAGKSGIVVLTGGPGTGKTTTVSGILNLFYALGLNVVLTAPTGRAAKRLSELCNEEAKTIHRLLETSYSVSESKMIFQKNIQNPIEADAIIIDEASMIDINLVRGLLKAVKYGTRLVFVGDPDQLPPVGAGNFLQDIINSQAFNVIKLDEIFRQAKESMIVLNAHSVNQGIPPKTAGKESDFFIMPITQDEQIVETISTLVSQRLPKFYGLKSNQIQVLSPSKKSKAGTFVINKKLQEVLNPSSEEKNEKRFGDIIFRENDRVMQIKNNYDVLWTKDNINGSGIFNGDIGEIIDIDLIEELIVINFDEKIAIYSFDMLRELDLAYALTVHKSQGSEFDAVVLAVSKTSPKLLTRSILYTAITRAKNLLVIVGDTSVLNEMVANNLKNKRYSGLKVRIKENFNNDI